jgi:hypothetical protein
LTSSGEAQAKSQEASLLTDTDRARIREECLLREEIRRELRRPGRRKETGRLMRFLNSSFGRLVFSTFLGSFGLTLVGKIILNVQAEKDHIKQREQAVEDRKKEHNRALRDRKNALLSSLPQDAERYTSILGSLNRDRLWLSNPKSGPTNDIGRKRTDVENDYMTLSNRFLEARSVKADLKEIGATFSSPKVKSIVSQYHDAVEQASGSKNPEEVSGTAGKLLEQLMAAMSEELEQGAEASD